ncbi:hypothetical protein [Pantoea vagans]|nr:hypothetical protein [Pantoea vagans]
MADLILTLLPGLPHWPDALILSGAFVLAYDVFCEIEGQRK